MPQDTETSYAAFKGSKLLGTGSLADVAGHAKRELEPADCDVVYVFNNRTGRVVDLDYRGTVAEC